MRKEKIYYRCYICDYCAINSPGPVRNFSTDKKTNEPMCSECVSVVGNTLFEFGFDEHSSPISLGDIHKMGNAWRTSTQEESYPEEENINELLEEFGVEDVIEDDTEETFGSTGDIFDTDGTKR